jgi:hypothetical protein
LKIVKSHPKGVVFGREKGVAFGCDLTSIGVDFCVSTSVQRRKYYAEKYMKSSPLKLYTRTGVVERFREYGPRESTLRPDTVTSGGEAAAYNP